MVEWVEAAGELSGTAAAGHVSAVHVDLVGELVQDGGVAVPALHRVTARLDDVPLTRPEVVLLQIQYLFIRNWRKLVKIGKKLL